MNKPLYEQDFFRWTEQQAQALRAAASMRINVPLDWENLAEEVESLGRSQRSELGSRILVIVEHLMKLQASSAEAPRRSWRATILRERALIEGLLDDSPSLRNAVPGLISRALRQARRLVEEQLAEHGEASATLRSLDYTEDQVLGDWLPD
jgi:hypothetical protein